MVNARKDFFARFAVVLLAVAVLTAGAWNRGAEYDEQYTMFLTAGAARPIWPDTAFPASLVRNIQSGHAGFAAIAHDLRRTDVHPPLYFWAVALWRFVAGDGLFTARLLSVGCGLGAVAAVGAIARRSGIPPALAMLLTLGCYGFAYTSGIARGFALAQMLTLAGVACALGGRGVRRGLLTGTLFGAALLANYLALFVGAAVLATIGWSGLTMRLRTGNLLPLPPPSRGNGEVVSPAPCRRAPRSTPTGTVLPLFAGFAPFLLIAVWFYLAQRNSRTSQFAPFELLPALARLARYTAGNLCGGLPLYTPDALRPTVTTLLALGIIGLIGLALRRWPNIATSQARGLFAAAAVAPPLGLLALGIIFDNTPIELRYLSFATPFIALLLAGAIHAAPRKRLILGVVLTIQVASVAGLILRSETMQPARATAAGAAELAEGGVVLIPRGNDGVGVVGAFATEAPPNLLLLVIGPNETPANIRARAAPFRRVVLALMARDRDSQAAVPAMRAAFLAPEWHAVATRIDVEVWERNSETE